MKSLALLLAFSAVPAAAQNVGHDQHGGTHPTSVEESDSGKDEVGTDPAPAVATDYAADRVFPAAQMEPSRAALLREGQFRTSTLRIERLEYRAVSGRNGYAWDAQAWTGGDVSRFVLSTAGEVESGHKPETFEVSAVDCR